MSNTCPQCGEEFKQVGNHMSNSSSCELTEEVLIDELERVKIKIGKTPTAKEMRSKGKIDVSTYQRRFGSWNDALKSANIRINQKSKIGKDELIEELYRMKDEYGHTPKFEEMNEEGNFTTPVYFRVFGSWNNALKEAGFKVNQKRDISKETLISELHYLENKLDKTPSSLDMVADGNINVSTYVRTFGSWNDALKEAGFEVNKVHKTSREELIAEIHKVEEKIGHVPTSIEIKEHGKFSIRPYIRIFGLWNNALMEAGFEPPKKYRISNEALISELQKIGTEIERTPTSDDMGDRGEFSQTVYIYQFGSWNEALKKAGFEPSRRYPIEPQWAGDVEDYYGESWPQKRAETVERDNYECQVCGDDGLLHVHHITPRRMFEYPDNSNTLDNLVTLCASCHGKFEGQWTDADVESFVEKARESGIAHEDTVSLLEQNSVSFISD